MHPNVEKCEFPLSPTNASPLPYNKQAQRHDSRTEMRAIIGRIDCNIPLLGQSLVGFADLWQRGLLANAQDAIRVIDVGVRPQAAEAQQQQGAQGKHVTTHGDGDKRVYFLHAPSDRGPRLSTHTHANTLDVTDHPERSFLQHARAAENATMMLDLTATMVVLYLAQ